MLAWNPAITGMRATITTAIDTAKFSKITITITAVTTNSRVMRKLNHPVMFTIKVTNYILSISMLSKSIKA